MACLPTCNGCWRKLVLLYMNKMFRLAVCTPRHSRERSQVSGWLLLIGLLVLLLAWVRPAGAWNEADFLPPEQAFRLSAQVQDPDVLTLRFDIAPGYYLYREPFAFQPEPEAITLGVPELPQGTVVFDPFFEKELETYRNAVEIRLPLPPEAQPFVLQVTSQGCADAGLCYPPQTWPVALDYAPQAGWVAQALMQDSAWGDMGDVGRSAAGSWGDWLQANDLGLAEALAGAALWQTVGVFFLLGVLLSFTPCVLPMVPILSSLLVGDQARQQSQGNVSGRWRGLSLAAAYVLGMSLVYTAAGIAAGLTGASLAATLQTPWVLAVFASLLGLLALAMFDVITVQVPASWQTALSQGLNRLPGGSYTGVFMMGAVSALIVGPCVAAPLAGALLYISQTGDVVMGGAALFAMAWGMGVILLLAGASAGSWLPRTGAWMQDVKYVFGVLLLAVAWWMLLPVLSPAVAMGGWAVLAFFAASILGAFTSLDRQAGLGRRTAQGMGWLLALIGAIQVVGLASGGRDALQPLAQFATSPASFGVPSLATGPVPGSPPIVGVAPLQGSGSSGDLVQQLGGASFASSLAPGTALAPAGDDGGWSSTLTDAAPASGLLAGVGQASGVTSHGFQRVATLAELEQRVKAARGRPVLLDFYADWCVSCKEMERFTFSQPEVAARMARMELLQVDVTANNAADRELLKRFRLFGPPGIIFFDAQGREQDAFRVIGFQNAERFAAVLDRVLTADGPMRSF